MTRIARIPITNIYADGDYTGRVLIGRDQRPMNLLLDSGSSALAVDGRKYRVDAAKGDRTTRLAQYSSYSDGSHWAGGVIKTTVAIGEPESRIVAQGINTAIAYDSSRGMFGKTDGILGLAYAPLDEAYKMPKDTAAHHYAVTSIREGKPNAVAPYMTELSHHGVTADIFSFLTRRSEIHRSRDVAADKLNQGWMILGGGAERRELYTGKFQTVKVMADEWYCTSLKAIIVGDTPPLAVHLRPAKGNPSNSIVDSGTNSLDIGPLLLSAVISRFKPAQQAQLNASIHARRHIPISELKLRAWPELAFILEGESKDVTLRVAPQDYWQVNAPKPGFAKAAITIGDPGFTILGLPLMNGYFTVFDGEAAGGRGVIRFATARR
jgi:hypothetical protein